MHATLTVLALLLPAADAASPYKGREPNPFAPSLPELTRAEEEDLDRILDRFMKYDIGQLRGEEGKKALREFEKLGPEAIPAMIRGMNKAALINHSCPAAVIAKKLRTMLLTSDDRELLLYASENIGAGVDKSPHLVILRNLRMEVNVRKGLLGRTPAGPKPPSRMTAAELSEAAGSRTGATLKAVLIELETRRGDDVLAGLATAALNSDRELAQLSRDLLERHLRRQPTKVLVQKLKDPNAEVRQAASRLWVGKVIALLAVVY
jgi:hypothetical protein